MELIDIILIYLVGVLINLAVLSLQSCIDGRFTITDLLQMIIMCICSWFLPLIAITNKITEWIRRSDKDLTIFDFRNERNELE